MGSPLSMVPPSSPVVTSCCAVAVSPGFGRASGNKQRANNCEIVLMFRPRPWSIGSP